MESFSIRDSLVSIKSQAGSLSFQSWLLLGVMTAITYILVRVVYLLWFHPLARFPGPRLAAVSDVWYAYSWFSGRYPWVMQNVLEKYGDVVRVAPNELVFLTPKAYTDIYTSTRNNRPAFVKSNMLDTGDKYEGLPSERDIDKHRVARKQLSPAFSNRALKQYEPVIHENLNRFIETLEEYGQGDKGVNITEWFEWVTTDIGGRITLGHNYGNVEHRKSQPLLEAILGLGHWLTVKHVMRRFSLIYPLSFLLLPPKVALGLGAIYRTNRVIMRKRIEERHDQKQLDYMSALIRPDSPLLPLEALVSQASHLVFDHFESSSVLAAGFHFLLTNPESLTKLQRELRDTFQSSEQITDGALQELTWLRAIIEEMLRLHTNVPYGLPRISPGIAVDGHYVAKGCVVSTAAYATTHSQRYFQKPYEFRPERWLPTTHPEYNSLFNKDDKGSFKPFSVGSRNCIGQPMAYVVLRLMFSKLLWKFDWELLNKGEVDWDRDLRLYAVWEKPDVVVRVTPYRRV